MSVLKKAILCCALPMFVACTAVGVQVTGNPLEKLNQADDFMQQDRPLSAQQNIHQAIDIYEKSKDMHGLGNAHRQYADFLRSPVVEKWQNVFQKGGFQDKTVTYDNRLARAEDFYRKAITYYDAAVAHHLKNERYDAITNVHINAAWAQLSLRQTEPACGHYNKAMEAYQEHIRLNPQSKPFAPKGSASVAEYIGKLKAQAKCP